MSMSDVFRCTGPVRCAGLVPYDGDRPACPCCGWVYLGIAESERVAGVSVVRGRHALPWAPSEDQPDGWPGEQEKNDAEAD